MDSVRMFCHHLHLLEYNWARGDEEAKLRRYAIVEEKDKGE